MYDFSKESLLERSITVKVPTKNVVYKTGRIKRPLSKKNFLAQVCKELEKENIGPMKDLGVYTLNLKVWVVRED